MSDKQRLKGKREFMFEYIALWQFIAFVLLIFLIWGSEIMDLPALFFHASSTGIDLLRGFTLTAATMLVAIIAVGNTYLQQKHILKGALILCSKCHKVKISKGAWEQLDQYLQKKTLATLSRDLCPECFQSMEREIASANVEMWKSETKSPKN